MPNYKGHLVGGTVGFALIVFLCSLHLAPCLTLLEWFTCVLVGSLFPDIDTKSKGQKLVYGAISCALFYYIFQKKFTTAVIIALVAMLPILSKHRGIFHHFWFILAIVISAVICISISYPAMHMRIAIDAAFFVLGVASHLYLDMGLKRMLRIS